MPSDSVLQKAGKLKAFIEGLSDFKIESPDIPYGHMGATITDAMLQAGLTWETVVKPRVDRVRNFPEARTTSGFRQLLREKGSQDILRWTDPEKIRRIVGMVDFFCGKGLESEKHLHRWLLHEGHVIALKRLRGIGHKTADYFKGLVGISTTAIDRHILAFLALAEVEASGYGEAKEIVHATADVMNINRTVLDHSIWKYMSSKRQKARRACAASAQGRTVRRISPHDGDLELRHSFEQAWAHLGRQSQLVLKTLTGKEFHVLATRSNGREVVKFLQEAREYGRAHRCCWGRYYNCSRTRIGMYIKALDDQIID